MSRAKAVEAAIFAQFGIASAAYKGKIRSSYVNLKDKGNPSLRENIVSGDLSAERFSKMTSEVRQGSWDLFLKLICSRKCLRRNDGRQTKK